MNDVSALKKVYKMNKNLIIRKFPQTVMVYDDESGDMHELNNITGEIFDYLNEGIDLNKIYIDLCEKYDGNNTEILEDFLEIIDRMVKVNLIEIVDEKNMSKTWSKPTIRTRIPTHFC